MHPVAPGLAPAQAHGGPAVTRCVDMSQHIRRGTSELAERHNETGQGV